MSPQIATLLCGWIFCAAGWAVDGPVAALLLFSVAGVCFVASLFGKK